MWSPTYAVLASGRQHAVIVNEDGDLHAEGNQYLMALSLSGKALNTGKAYSRSICKLLNWTHEQGLDWRELSLLNLSRFRRWYEETPTRFAAPPKPAGLALGMAGVVGFLRFCAHEGLIGSWVAEQLVEPKMLGTAIDRQNPSNNKLSSRVKVKVPEEPFVAVAQGKVDELLALPLRPRTAFLIQLLWCTGVRIGEALSLHREDFHTLPDNRAIACNIAGAHVHVGRHDDHPTASNKSGPRAVPIDALTVQALDRWLDYRYQPTRRRDTGGVRKAPDLDSRFVFINVQGTTANQPMTYTSVQEAFGKLSRRLDVDLRPHMLRHARATYWVRNGVDLDIVRTLLGHSSVQTTSRYLHATDEELRMAVDRVGVA